MILLCMVRVMDLFLLSCAIQVTGNVLQNYSILESTGSTIGFTHLSASHTEFINMCMFCCLELNNQRSLMYSKLIIVGLIIKVTRKLA